MVTLQNPVRVGHNAWHVCWSSSLPDPTYRVYRGGKLIATTKVPRITVTLATDTYVDLEVLDDAAEVPETLPSGHVTLQWDAVSHAASYRVEELVDAAWVARGVVAGDGSSTHSFLAAPIADGATGTFRVVPVGVNGNEGTPTQKAITMVRSPDPPVASGTVVQAYDSGTGKVTFSAA